jgi:hypothetical protein
MDKDYEYFEKWYTENERRFHCSQMDERQIAYSAFLEGRIQSRQAAVSGSLPTMQEIKTSLYKCAKVTIESDGVKMERLFEKEAKAMLALFGGNDR